MKHVVALLLPLALAACTDSSSSPATPATPASKGQMNAQPAPLPDRDIALAKKLMAEGAVVIDVRTAQEVAGGMVAGAHHIPIQELASRMGEVDKLAGGDKSKPFVLYCASGGRSGSAKQMLLKAGYTQVTNAGGYSDLR
jgi:phage shock protein E